MENEINRILASYQDKKPVTRQQRIKLFKHLYSVDPEAPVNNIDQALNIAIDHQLGLWWHCEAPDWNISADL